MSTNDTYWYVRNRGSYKTPDTTYDHVIRQLDQPGILYSFAELYSLRIDGEVFFYLPDKLRFGMKP